MNTNRREEKEHLHSRNNLKKKNLRRQCFFISHNHHSHTGLPLLHQVQVQDYADSVQGYRNGSKRSSAWVFPCIRRGSICRKAICHCSTLSILQKVSLALLIYADSLDWFKFCHHHCHYQQTHQGYLYLCQQIYCGYFWKSALDYIVRAPLYPGGYFK